MTRLDEGGGGSTSLGLFGPSCFLPFPSNSLFTFTMDVEDVAALRQAVDDCGDRGLLAASKWHAPLLMERGTQGLRFTTIGQLIYYNVCH